jgi:hypothetical protein
MSSIFSPPAPPTPRTPTQQATAMFQQYVQQASTVFQRQASLAIAGWKFVWANPQKLKPQQVCDLIQAAAVASGSDCTQIFASHQATVVYLNGQAPGIVPQQYTAVPAGVTYKANADGSLTLKMPK